MKAKSKMSWQVLLVLATWAVAISCRSALPKNVQASSGLGTPTNPCAEYHKGVTVNSDCNGLSSETTCVQAKGGILFQTSCSNVIGYEFTDGGSPLSGGAGKVSVSSRQPQLREAIGACPDGGASCAFEMRFAPSDPSAADGTLTGTIYVSTSSTGNVPGSDTHVPPAPK